MKLLKLATASFLVFLFSIQNCYTQINLKAIAESRNNDRRLSYIDSSGKGYDKSECGGMPMKVVFKNIEFRRHNNILKLEGLTTVFFNDKDTIGFCCWDYFIAQPSKGYLRKIRKLGETNSKQLGDTTKPEGFFSLEIKVEKRDRLYFTCARGVGLEEFDIGKLCFERDN